MFVASQTLWCSLILAGKAMSQPLPHSVKLQWPVKVGSKSKILTYDEHTSLLGSGISYVNKKSYLIEAHI